jgi:PAS domain S-box-containing protein
VTRLAHDPEVGASAVERKYEALIENAADAVVSADQDGLITGFNPAAERIFGYPAGEALGKPLTILMPERLQDAHRQGLARFLATGEARVIGAPAEVIGRRKDGLEIPIELSLSSWEADGRTNFTAFVRDITERRHMEDVNQELASVVEQSQDAILRKTPEGIVTGWNSGAERLYGYSAEEMIGQPMQVLIPEERNGEEREILEKIVDGEGVAEYETVRVRKDGGAIDVAVTISPLRDAAGDVVGASAIGRDITKGKRAERELQRSNADLEQFAYVASHDLSEPLRVIAGFVDLLARRYEGQLDEEADRFIAFTVSGVERMQALIDDILAYSKAGRAELRLADVDTGELVEGVLADLDGLIEERGARVEVADLPTVWAEPVLLRQVFQNLIGNAIRFADEDAPHVRVSATSRRARWRIDVEDNGGGVDPAQTERIFEMFQRLHGRDVPGTGIGLAIAKRIVERHDGRIWVDPAPDGGSIFRFTIAQGQGTAA